MFDNKSDKWLSIILTKCVKEDERNINNFLHDCLCDTEIHPTSVIQMEDFQGYKCHSDFRPFFFFILVNPLAGKLKNWP